MTLLRVRDLTVRYGGPVAVRGVDLDVDEGEMVALVGANGAGKTSTMKAVMGLVPSEGQVQLAGQDITREPTERIVAAGMTLTPEGRHVFGGLTVAENLRLSGWGQPRDVQRRRQAELLDVFPILGQRLGQSASTLSGGEQQQLAIARSLMSRPRLLLLDEPSLGLAPILVTGIVELIGQLHRDGLAILLVEQRAEQFLGIAQRCYTLVRGEIDAHGATDELRHSGALERAYMGQRVSELRQER